MADSDRRIHWESVYATKGEKEVSWFEEIPEVSLSLLREAGLNPSLAVIDIGGGASRLVDALVASDQAHVTVLDLSANGLSVARARLADADRVKWVVSDVTTWVPDRQYDLWHDRAAFHFLTSSEDRHAYSRLLSAALKPGGAAIIGTFAPTGQKSAAACLSPATTLKACRLPLAIVSNFSRHAGMTTRRRGDRCRNSNSAPSRSRARVVA